jgi:hypothetical protein
VLVYCIQYTQKQRHVRSENTTAIGLLAVIGIGLYAYGQFQPADSGATTKSAADDFTSPISKHTEKVGSEQITAPRATLKPQVSVSSTDNQTELIAKTDVPPEKRIKAKLSAIEHNAPTDARDDDQPRPHGYEHKHTHGEVQSARPPGEPKKTPPNQPSNP